MGFRPEPTSFETSAAAIICGVVPHIARCVALLISTVATFQIARSQQPATRLPRFEDYPVTEVFTRAPHPPILVTPEQHMFRTRIREGVEKGWGVWINGEWAKEQNRPGPNFAGHYIVIIWGCGSGCIEMAVSDAATGVVYDPPVSDGGLALPMLVFPNSAGRAADTEWRRDSRLMIVRATPHANRQDAVSYAFYSLWQGEHWTLLRRVQIEE
jgi:hypothetical protein